ncbi:MULTISPECIES: hypothetical protein [Rhizobium]|nr:hypothetical protein [Rhizobium miluonense]
MANTLVALPQLLDGQRSGASVEARQRTLMAGTPQGRVFPKGSVRAV